MTTSARTASRRASLSLLPVLVATGLAAGAGCGGGSAGEGPSVAGAPLPEDPKEAYAALVPNCGTVVIGLTPMRADELLADPFALPAEASLVSVHAGAAPGAWRPSASASVFSARHPVLSSTLMNPEGDPAQCLRAMGLFSEVDGDTLEGGVERRVRVYFAQSVERVEAPPPAEALGAQSPRVPASSFATSLRRIVSEGRPAAGGATLWEAKETRDFAIRMTCEQGLELAPLLQGYEAAEYTRALDAGEQSGTYCEPRGWDGYTCVGYVPQPTLDRCTLVVERAALSTEDGRAFHASLAGTLARRGSDADPYYELTLDKVRVE